MPLSDRLFCLSKLVTLAASRLADETAPFAVRPGFFPLMDRAIFHGPVEKAYGTDGNNGQGCSRAMIDLPVRNSRLFLAVMAYM
jgi:hypothetical protein